MIIIGERLNSSRKTVRIALEKRDEEFILKEAYEQVKAGANFLDINVSALPDQEIELLRWIIPLIQSNLDICLALDSPNPQAFAEGLPLHRGRAFLNSLTLEKNRWNSIIPLIKKYNPLVIVLCLDETGLPGSPEKILKLAQKIKNDLEKEGIELADVFFDPLVRPLGVNFKAGAIFLQSLRLIKLNLPEIKTVAGISNVSFGLPRRSLLNRTLLTLAIEAGLDAAIIDPCDVEIMASLKATLAISGQDNYLKGYLKFVRESKLQNLP
ncbi:MAG: dihydropteroate synthase [Candidatus Aminicenantes bacterium]|nr:dihydropteroate synthase [Candidatus Aminicenantes bacterium]